MQKSSIALMTNHYLIRMMRLAVIGAMCSGLLSVLPLKAAEQSSGLKLQENAPDRYVVERGDTLWSIAAKFLKEPWRWPELWRMNQEQIRDPNRIFPGNIIVLDRSAVQARLVQGNTVKLTPQVIRENIADQAIAPLPRQIVESFLTEPLVIEAGGLQNAPRIIATQENRVNLGPGGLAYVTGTNNDTKTLWQIYRPGKQLIDPETKAVLGTEAVFLGTGRVTRAGEPATMEIVTARKEISNGDRLIAAGPVRMNQYVPRAPKSMMRGRVVGLYDGLVTSESARYSIIAISRGKRDGVEEGYVLAIQRAGGSAPDIEANKSRDTAPKFMLPDERYGLLMVFRVFDAVSYALVMESSRPVAPGDIVVTP